MHDVHGLDVAHEVAARARGAKPAPRRKRERNEELEPIADVFAQFVQDQGWGEQLGVRQLLLTWPQLVGVLNAQHSKPVGFHEGVLTVEAESTTWATSLRQIAPQLVAALNEKLGQQSVTRVVVTGPKGPSWKHGKRTAPGRGPRDTYG
jgi:predicted nucleic acid-binding Zn ribbon protein